MWRQGRPCAQLCGHGRGHTELGVLLRQDGNDRGAALLRVLQSGQGVRTTTLTMPMAMAAAVVMAVVPMEMTFMDMEDKH